MSLQQTLSHNPIIGIISTVIGFVTPFFSTITPIVQFVVAVVGLGIGLLTLEAKLVERKNRKKNK